jgi:hypothetical protein
MTERWEYRVESYTPVEGGPSWVEVMNGFGADGWELASEISAPAVQNAYNRNIWTPGYDRATFKRRLE